MLSETKYQLIYADPPWRYDGGVDKTREIENHYNTMSIEDICAMEIPAEEDCVLFLWATQSQLVFAMRTIDAWGFTYKTGMVWDKMTPGMGYYWRGVHELLLLGTKGSPGAPKQDKRPVSLLRVRRCAHSAKPPEVYSMIESMYPDKTKFELFQRVSRPGWNGMGNQIQSELLSPSPGQIVIQDKLL